MTEVATARRSNDSSIRNIYDDIVTQLNDYLYPDLESGTALAKEQWAINPAITSSSIDLNIWAANIGAQEDAKVLDTLLETAPSLAEKVREKLLVIRDAAGAFQRESVRFHSGGLSPDESKDLM
jgi:hypothetical protein